MKKIIVILALIMIGVLIINNNEEYIVIPNEAIRVRVIANSNDKNEIKIKEQLKDELNIKLYKLLNNVNSINDARVIIKNNLNFINKIVDKKLKELNYDNNYSINYGLNYFPEKMFKGVSYKSGQYESLVITLGNGLGPNYWCVLFPPLCGIDENSKEIEYRSIISDLLRKYI